MSVVDLLARQELTRVMTAADGPLPSFLDRVVQ